MKSGKIKTKELLVKGYRIDPTFHLSEGVRVKSCLQDIPYELSTIRDNSERIFLGNIFSRIFVKKPEKGIPYLSASDTILSNINTGRYLSKKQAESLKYLMLKKNWILITCSGTLGNVTYTNKMFENHIATHDLIRVIPNNHKVNGETVYAFLSSKYGYYQITQSQFGGVVKHVNDNQIGKIVIPIFPMDFQTNIKGMICEASKLRDESFELLCDSKNVLKKEAGLRDLCEDDYDYFGPSTCDREPSCFIRNRKEINTSTINAFNYSKRIENTLNLIKKCEYVSFYDALDDDKIRTPRGVNVVELEEGHGIRLINQSDIFNRRIKGKWVRRRKQYDNDLLKYGEILIAKIGTLGENETFCHVVFVGEDLENQLTSSAFMKFKSTKNIPSGYLYAWLDTDYGFRLIRSTHYGTKLCYPNPFLMYKLPVPIISEVKMKEIDEMVRVAHTKSHRANVLESQAISMVEQEIEKWNKQ